MPYSSAFFCESFLVEEKSTKRSSKKMWQKCGRHTKKDDEKQFTQNKQQQQPRMYIYSYHGTVVPGTVPVPYRTSSSSVVVINTHNSLIISSNNNTIGRRIPRLYRGRWWFSLAIPRLVLAPKTPYSLRLRPLSSLYTRLRTCRCNSRQTLGRDLNTLSRTIFVCFIVQMGRRRTTGGEWRCKTAKGWKQKVQRHSRAKITKHISLVPSLCTFPLARLRARRRNRCSHRRGE